MTIRRHLLAPVAAAFVLAACASGTTPPVYDAAGDFPTRRAALVFATAYENIYAKHLDPVDMADIGVEGLRGLTTIDPKLSIAYKPPLVTLSREGKVITAIEHQDEASPDAWADTTAIVASSARAASKALHDASLEDVYEAVLDAALSHLDKFSRYSGAREAREQRARRDGFGGIGIRFRLDGDAAVVSSVFPDSPAEQAGLKEGDRLTQIDEQSVVGMAIADLRERLRGGVGSDISLTIARAADGKPEILRMKRSHVVPPSVFTRRVEDWAQIRITNFNQKTATSLARTLRDLADQETEDHPIRGLILDLRGNPGGLLKQAVEVADMFLTGGDIVNTRGRHPDSLQHYDAGGADLARGLPMVVLIDGKSASASEIVAAALQDQDRAVVVGTTSYGKGTVQTVVRLPNDGEMTLTWSRFIAPSGYAIDRLGVNPTLCTSGLAGVTVADPAQELNLRVERPSLFAAWRSTEAPTTEKIRELREACPAQSRKGTPDSLLARKLLASPDLFARSLARPNDPAIAGR